MNALYRYMDKQYFKNDFYYYSFIKDIPSSLDDISVECNKSPPGAAEYAASTPLQKVKYDLQSAIC